MERLLANLLALILISTAALNAAVGDGVEVLWGFSTDAKITGSPAISADGVIYATTQSGALYAVNPDGTKRWLYQSGKLALSPSIAQDGTVYFGSKDGFVHAVNPNGSLRWKLAATNETRPPVSDIAIAPDGAIYFAAGENNLYRVLPNGTVDWAKTIVAHQSGVSVDNDGTVYFQVNDNNGGRLTTAFNPDGSEKWTNLLSTLIPHDPVPPAVTSDRIYITDAFFLTALDKSGALLWRTTNELGTSYATPSIGADGSILVDLFRTSGNRGVITPGGIISSAPNGQTNWHAAVGPDIPGSPALTADGQFLANGYQKVFLVAADGQSSTNIPVPGLIEAYFPGTETSPAITKNGIGYVCISNVLAAIKLNSPLANSSWPMYGGNPQHTWRPTVTGSTILIAQNPTTQTVVDQAPLTLGVAAQSGLDLAYQWYFADTPLTDQTNATYHLPATATTNAGNYYATISNSSGSATSAVAQVTVHYSLTLTNTAGGSVAATPSSPAYLPGSVVSVSATPAANFIFVGWSGDASGSANPLSITLQSNTVIQANFLPGITLQTTAGIGGSIGVSPLQSLYLIGSDVELTATPSAGYAFQNWTGASNSTSNPLILTLTQNSTISANFLDVASPTVAITTPAHESTTTNKNFSLTGTITDNGSVATSTFRLNGGSAQPLTITGGAYSVAGLTLAIGTNLVQVDVADTAGNTNSTQSVVVWDPPRILTLLATNSLQEGTEFNAILNIESSGEIGATTFKILFDTNYIAQLDFDWNDDLLAGSFRAINTSISGELTGSFSLPGTALPAGVTNLASIQFRARSVPDDLTTTLSITINDVSTDSGSPLPQGNAGVPAQVEIRRRLFIADNNANNLYDVGDATIIQRLLAGLDPVRAWDVTLNDLNASSQLDSGDLTRVLRAVVGLDPQPEPPSAPSPLEEPKKSKTETLKSSSLRIAQAPASGFEIAPSTTQVNPGDTVVCTINLNGAGVISGLSYTLNYNPAVLRLTSAASYSAGPYIAPTAQFIWNSGAPGNDFAQQSGRLSFAATAPQTWTGSGAVALVTFKVQPQIQTVGSTSVTLTQGKTTSNGFRLTEFPTATATVAAVPIEAPDLDSDSLTVSNGQIQIAFSPNAGLTYRVLATVDFEQWVDLGPVTVTNGQANYQAALSAPFRFYKIKTERAP